MITVKRIAAALILAVSATGLFAQSKINGQGLIQIEKYRSERATRISTMGTDPEPVPQVSVIVRLREGADVSVLNGAGRSIGAVAGCHAIVRLPITDVESMAELAEVESVSFAGKRRMLMSYARAASGVDEVHSGIDVSGAVTAYTGRGVVVGLMDGGLDPNHINFKNSDGTSRVKRLWHITGEYGSVKEYTDATVSTFTTDDEEETHATHVAGIMGGGYRGSGTYYKVSNPASGAATLTTGNIPFYGVAYESDLALSVGDLYDDNIIDGVDYIASYAESQGMPAVVNLSLGSNYGPHDGSDDFSQMLDALGERAVICVAAGNEGSKNISIEKEFTASETSVKTLLYYNNRYVNGNYGYLDIWASDGEPLTVTISNCSSSGALSYTTTVSKNANGTRITSGVRSGTIYVYSGVDGNSGRYNVLFDLDTALPKSGRFAITVSGKAGQTVNMYFDGYSEFTNSYSNNATKLSGFTAGTPDVSISGMACGKNVIPVGAYSTLGNYTDLSGYSSNSTGETVGSVASFSSYGHDFFGRQLPLVLAPGTAIISSYSRTYLTDFGEYETTDEMVGYASNGTARDYWGAMEGTSMATPFVTGTVGLWLQANPQLTVADVIEVIKQTSKNDSYTAAAPEKSGYGKIDAAAGLKYILSHAGLPSVSADRDNNLIVTVTDGGIEVFFAGETCLEASLYDLQGRAVGSASASSDAVTLPTGGLMNGVYVLRVNCGAGVMTRKVTLR